MNGRMLKLGFLPLLDAAPLIIADRMGFAGEEGLTLDLVPAPSWASLRDMLAGSAVEAAHLLSPLPVALALGLGGRADRFEVLSVLSVNGQVFGARPELADRVRGQGAYATGHALLNAAGKRLRIGVPFAFSMHAELIRYWLEGLKRNLPEDLQVITVPPPQMAAALSAGEIDAFMVGEPWGSMAADAGTAGLLLPGAAIWGFAPEKVLATRAGWAEQRPDLAGPLLRAVWRAGAWLARSENRMTASEVIARSGYLAVPTELIERLLSGTTTLQGVPTKVPHLIEFHDGAATFPWRSQAAWIAARLAARFNLDREAAIATAKTVFRSDLYRRFLDQTGADMPGASERVEGALFHKTAVASRRGELVLAPDAFFDAQVFDFNRAKS